MKKTFFSKIFFAFLAFIFFTNLFYSCKTVSDDDLPPVHPLSVLRQDSSIYVKVPVSQYSELTKNILLAEIGGLKEKEAAFITERIDFLYAGLGSLKDRSRLELVAKGNFPPAGKKLVLDKKNGFEKRIYNASSENEKIKETFPCVFDIYSSSSSEFALSFPSSQDLLCAKEIEPMLNLYALRGELPETEYVSFLEEGDSDILFYITRPGQYLRKLIGQTVNIGCTSIYGKLKYVKNEKSDEYTGKYSLEFNLKLKDAKAVSLMTSLLKLSFTMMDASVSNPSPLVINISGMNVSESQIIDLFTRDPITGKHYRVEKGIVVEENR